jgi:hypothetical protein
MENYGREIPFALPFALCNALRLQFGNINGEHKRCTVASQWTTASPAPQGEIILRDP